MINVATHAKNRLRLQEKAIVLQRLLNTVHHRNFIFQVALQVHHTTPLQILW